MSYTDTEDPSTDEATGDTEPETEASATTDAAPAKERGKAVHALELVGDELPDNAPRKPSGGHRTSKYAEMFEQIKADDAHWTKWFCVTTFSTSSGAGSAEKTLRKNPESLPAGVWELTKRVVTNDEGARISKLFARYVDHADVGTIRDEGAAEGEGDDSE